MTVEFSVPSSPGSPSTSMPAIKDLKLPEGDKDNIIALNKEVVKLQTKITLHIKDGEQFPALMEINRLKTLDDPSGSGAYKDLARSQAKVKLDEVSRLISEMETYVLWQRRRGGSRHSQRIQDCRRRFWPLWYSRYIIRTM